MSGTMKNDGPPAAPFEGVHVPAQAKAAFKLLGKSLGSWCCRGLTYGLVLVTGAGLLDFLCTFWVLADHSAMLAWMGPCWQPAGHHA